jgi:Mg2+ and Co2+ transporter CorA
MNPEERIRELERLVLQLAERLWAAADVLRMLAEKKEKRGEP